jgi:hypothetical protein
MWFKPAGENVVIRWLHLSKFVKTSGFVREGTLIAVTGNTGKSDIPHLHEDIWKNGRVTLNFTDTLNPWTYYKQSSLKKEDHMHRTHNGAIYALSAGFWLLIATSGEEYKAEWKVSEFPPVMTDAQFKAFPLHKRTIK